MSADGSSLFEPDALLPSQYASIAARDDGVRPERRLMLAILEDAIYCIQRHALARSPASRVLFAEAAAWFESTEREWLFSFESICDTLGLAPDQVRLELPLEQSPRVLRERRIPRIVALTRHRQALDSDALHHPLLRVVAVDSR